MAGLARVCLSLIILFAVNACSASTGPRQGQVAQLSPQPPVPPQTEPHDTPDPLTEQCLTHEFAKSKQVTHYMVPLLNKYNKRICDQLEGSCIYQKKAKPYLHNFGYKDQLLADARCKNGYGNMKNCLHPCRVVAASMAHHRFGQILFLKELVGKKCGNLERDGYEITHDGYVVVYDTGSPVHFNKTGRFDFFWGRCKTENNGVCPEGAEDISSATTNSDYCVVWDPSAPQNNVAIKAAVTAKVKAEALARGDLEAAAEFDLDQVAAQHASGSLRSGFRQDQGADTHAIE